MECVSSFPLMPFMLWMVHNLTNSVRQFGANLCFVSLNWGVVGDGLRPRLCSEMMGQATLPPFPCCWYPKVRPPSARWNASMVFSPKFVNMAFRLGLCMYDYHFWDADRWKKLGKMPQDGLGLGGPSLCLLKYKKTWKWEHIGEVSP